MNSTMRTDKINATVTGVFFIIAAVAAITGLILYDPLLNHSDYLIRGARYSNQIVLGAFLELILSCSAVGTGIMLYPYLRKVNESLGMGYVCFRMLEVVFILIGIVSVLSLLTLSISFTNTTAPDAASFQATARTLKAIHEWTFMLGPNFMLGINTFIYSYVLFQSKLVPRKISVIGILGAVLVFTAALLELFGIILQISIWGALLGMPIFVYEMTLAIWLIIKGFNYPVETVN
ncbi:DUF4386 domain-containing protein [Flavipsychrobacter stenotrophus]|nr:DUF4386 domain-containing protein [Flavipsychrobacter stenotrophus]